MANQQTQDRLAKLEADIKAAEQRCAELAKRKNSDNEDDWPDAKTDRAATMELMHAKSVREMFKESEYEDSTSASTSVDDLERIEDGMDAIAERREEFREPVYNRGDEGASAVLDSLDRQSEIINENANKLTDIDNQKNEIYSNTTARSDFTHNATAINDLEQEEAGIARVVEEQRNIADVEYSTVSALQDQKESLLRDLSSGDGLSNEQFNQIDKLDRQQEHVTLIADAQMEIAQRKQDAIDIANSSPDNNYDEAAWATVDNLERRERELKAEAERAQDDALGITAAEESLGLSKPKPYSEFDSDTIEAEANAQTASDAAFTKAFSSSLRVSDSDNLTPPSNIQIPTYQLKEIKEVVATQFKHWEVETLAAKTSSSLVPLSAGIDAAASMSAEMSMGFGDIIPASTAKDKRVNDLTERDGKNSNLKNLKTDIRGKLKTWTDSIHASSGRGSRVNPLNSFLYNLDRNQLNTMLPNHECADITLMTRPCLPMQDSSLRQDDFLSLFDTYDCNSIAFIIRCYMDTFFSKYAATQKATDAIAACPSFNRYSPWLIPVCNGITSISGFPDPYLETETTEGGFHQEDQTYAKGGLGLFRSVDLNLTFKDPQGGPLMLLFQLWVTCIQMLRSGQIMAYKEFVDAQMLPYTVSIYRFNLDPSKTFITNFCKVTGCFPKSVPIGAIMNTSENERFISSSGRYSIPFVGNVVEYNRPSIIYDFNKLAHRYCPGIGGCENIPNLTRHNMSGLPYIVDSPNGLMYVHKKIPGVDIWDDRVAAIKATKAASAKPAAAPAVLKK